MPQISATEVQKAVRGSLPLIFTVTGPVHESFSDLDGIVAACLAELGQEKIQDALSYCLKELVLNAEKANAKRIYFEEHGLDIFSKDLYEKGMKGFRGELSRNLEHFLQKLKERQASIDIMFQYLEGSLAVMVRNAGRLTPGEQARIKERMDGARESRSFSDALETSLDHTEGAGLGIVMVLQFLRSIGLGEEAFSVRSQMDSTVASITIPVSEVQLDQMHVLAEAVVRDVESLPHFPERVVALLQLTEDPNARVSDITGHISHDPTLTAELLRHVNSAYYGLPSRIHSISQAVKLIGMRSLHHLMYSFGFHLVLDQHQPRMKALWDHSLRTAFYGFLLARDIKGQSEIQDDAYVSGLLHDIGFIVIAFQHPRAQEKLRRFCMEKNIPPSVLEQLSFGMNHAEVGALIARKWNFPDQLVEGIRYHHNPLGAGGAYRNIVFCVYLANAICDLERGLISPRQVEKEVLADFGLSADADLFGLASKLKDSFDRLQAPF